MAAKAPAAPVRTVVDARKYDLEHFQKLTGLDEKAADAYLNAYDQSLAVAYNTFMQERGDDDYEDVIDIARTEEDISRLMQLAKLK